MKILRFRFARSLGLLLIAAVFCSAQQPTSIPNLKEQIAKLERIDQDPTTPEDVKSLNRRFLNERRTQLYGLLKQRLDTLKKYQATVKAILSPDENKIIDDSIAEIQTDLQTLKPFVTAEANGATVESATSQPSGPAAPNDTSAQPPVTTAVSPTDISTGPATPATNPVPPQKVTPVSPAACSGDTNSYQSAPPLLTDAIGRVADDIISGAQTPVDAVAFKFDDMFLYAVADAVDPGGDSSIASVKSMKAYQYLGETIRTDKQIGAPAKGTGTTSLIEKPSFARLLGFAVEHGAITQQVSATGLTLSTSPYLLYTFNNGGDTAENYQRAGVLNRIGLSATFDLKDQNTPLANASRNQLSEWSVRARLFGDRSTRSKGFQDFWNKPGGPREAIEGRLAAVTQAFADVNLDPEFDPFIDVKTDLRNVVAAVVANPAYTAANAQSKKQMLTNASLCVIRKEVYEPINSNSFPVSKAKRDRINEELMPRIAASMRNIDAVRQLLNDKLEEFQKGPLATFAYTNHRKPIGSDYSEIKFLYQHEGPMLQPMKLVANFGASFYNKPAPLLNQQRLRDVGFGLSFEGQSSSPFLKNTADLSKITYAFTGSYQRQFENRGIPGRKADIAAFQFKLDVPVFAGFSVPLAVTYANATEQERKSHVRFNFGSGFDFDKLLAILKLTKQ
jgi:hypothetical protein